MGSEIERDTFWETSPFIIEPEALPAEPEPIRQPTQIVVREIIETLLLTLFIFWMVNSVTGRFRIEGESMLPNLHEDEYVLINKLSYYLEEPQHGDVIVLHYPRDPSRDFIKRVIGVPGDEIEIDNQVVTVNGVPLDEPYLNAPTNGTGSWTVPEGSFFVVGDNRNNSSDSRSGWFLPRDDIVGKAWVIYWPLKDSRPAPHKPHPELFAAAP